MSSGIQWLSIALAPYGLIMRVRKLFGCLHCVYRIEGPFSEELCTGVCEDEEAHEFSSLLSGSENNITSTD